MNYLVGLERLPEAPQGRVVTLGAFDGVHRGHQTLLQVSAEAAAQTGAQSTVLTFEPTPAEVLGRLGRPDLRLTLAEERRALLAAAGVQTLIVISFDQALRQTEPEDFARQVLAERLGARVVVASETHSFGRAGRGDIVLLSGLGCELGFQVRVLPLLSNEYGPISATHIRKLLWSGQVEAANDLLGRTYACSGPVVHGQGRGRGLGFATANLDVPLPKLMPGEGVYAGWARGEGIPGAQRCHPAAIVVGASPTFGLDQDARRLEVHLLDMEADLTGYTLTVGFCRRLRSQQRFASAEALTEQIQRDVAQVRAEAERCAAPV